MKNEYISDFLLERYLLKELSAEENKKVEEDIKNNPRTKQRINGLSNSNMEILNRYNPGVIADEINRRYDIQKPIIDKEIKKSGNTKRRFYIPAFSLAAAAVIILVILPLINNPEKTIFNTPEITRIKGDKAGLYIYRKINNNVELLKNGSHAAERDLLQIAYMSADDPYGVIISIDGRGTVTLHYPEKNGLSTRLEQKKKTLLPKSYELDDAPLFERFFLITGKEELNVPSIIGAAKSLAVISGLVLTDNLQLDKSMNQISILINKGE